MTAGAWLLRQRADTYSSDAHHLRLLGMSTEAAAYETVARELRVCADLLDKPEVTA